MVVLNSGNGQVSTISANRGTSVGVRGGKIAVNGKAIDTVVTLKPTNSDAPFLFEGKGYRGGLTLRANNGTMMVINSVPLEDYLLWGCATRGCTILASSCFRGSSCSSSYLCSSYDGTK